jgi:hypothetical protein
MARRQLSKRYSRVRLKAARSWRSCAAATDPDFGRLRTRELAGLNSCSNQSEAGSSGMLKPASGWGDGHDKIRTCDPFGVNEVLYH